MILSNEFTLLLGDTSRWQFFLLFCVFCFSLSISLMVGAHSVLQHDFPWILWGKGRREQTEHLKSWAKTARRKELGALSRHLQCMRDFQVRDTSVNNLGNSKGMSRSQGLWMSQAYGRNWKKRSKPELNVSPADVRLSIIIKMLPLNWTSLLFKGAL